MIVFTPVGSVGSCRGRRGCLWNGPFLEDKAIASTGSTVAVRQVERAKCILVVTGVTRNETLVTREWETGAAHIWSDLADREGYNDFARTSVLFAEGAMDAIIAHICYLQLYYPCMHSLRPRNARHSASGELPCVRIGDAICVY